MKKVITILGLFGLMIVQAQVGINQDEPKATLDIKAEKTDGTQVEGLLVPRISKEAAFNMATAPTQLQESNMVYVNDLSATFTPPTGDTTVSDITEKGYYFWNGDNKWVKTAGKDGAEWVYDPVTKQTNLKRSGTAPFRNKVYYDEKGAERNLDFNTVSFRASVLPLIMQTGSIENNSFNIKAMDASKIKMNINNKFIYGKANASYLRVDNATTSKYIRNKYTEIFIPSNSNKQYNSIVSSSSVAKFEGSGSIGSVYGGTGSVIIPKTALGSVSQAIGTEGSVYYSSSGSLNRAIGINAVNLIANDATTTSKIGSMIGTNHWTAFYGKAIATNTIGLHNELLLYENANVKITNSYGFVLLEPSLRAGATLNIDNQYGGFIGVVNKGQQKNYGILIDNVGNSTATENYAIYTKAGKVRLGDDVSIGTTAAPKKLEVSGNVKISGVTKLDPQSIVANGVCDNGSIGYGSDGNFYACKGGQWKQLQLAP